jgi:homoserine dehydrogenase
MRTLTLGLLGAGTVGTGFLRLLQKQAAYLEALGLNITLNPVLVRDPLRPRPVPARYTSNLQEALQGAELVVEVLGGTGLAAEAVLHALELGIPVITANKALLAERWEALKPYAKAGLLYYEASVMAGTPVLGALEGLRGSQLLELHAILNGTTSYILSRMDGGATYLEALREAQARGYAEADPQLDVEGWDAAHKLTVLARLLVDPDFSWVEVAKATRGITHLSPADLSQAQDEGKVIRLVASLFPAQGRWQARVRPVKLPLQHPLEVRETQNSLLYRGDPVAPVILKGPGAGGEITASALMSDLFRWLRGQGGQQPLPAPLPPPEHLPEPLEEA